MNISYQPQGLVITIPCTNPEAVHAMLMQSIAANMEYSAAAADKHRNYADEVIPLIELLKAMLPDEAQLCKMNGE